MWWFLLFRFLSHGQRKSSNRADFLSLFNHESAEQVSPPEPYANSAHLLVRGQLQNPDSASFEETFVRRCNDGVLRVAGVVQFAGMGGSFSNAGYMVEFDDQGRGDLVDLRGGFDPVSLKALPQADAWDGNVIPYKRAIPPPKLREGPVWQIWAGLIFVFFLALGMILHFIGF